MPGDFAQAGEIARRYQGNQDVAVSCTNRPIGRARHFSGKLCFLEFVDEQVQHAVHQRDVDTLPLARTRTLHQRGLNGGEAKNPAQHVGNEYGSGCRPIPIARIIHERAIETALGVNDHGIGGALGRRSGLPVA